MTSFLPIPKNFSSSTSSSTGIATLQKRLFGRKNSQEDPLPVVLLSYKADYDETLPIQGSIKIAISYSDLLFMIWHFPPYDWLSSDYSSSLAEMRSTWRPSFSGQIQGSWAKISKQHLLVYSFFLIVCLFVCIRSC